MSQLCSTAGSLGFQLLKPLPSILPSSDLKSVSLCNASPISVLSVVTNTGSGCFKPPFKAQEDEESKRDYLCSCSGFIRTCRHCHTEMMGKRALKRVSPDRFGKTSVKLHAANVPPRTNRTPRSIVTLLNQWQQI